MKKKSTVEFFIPSAEKKITTTTTTKLPRVCVCGCGHDE